MIKTFYFHKINMHFLYYLKCHKGMEHEYTFQFNNLKDTVKFDYCYHRISKTSYFKFPNF